MEDYKSEENEKSTGDDIVEGTSNAAKKTKNIVNRGRNIADNINHIQGMDKKKNASAASTNTPNYRKEPESQGKDYKKDDRKKENSSDAKKHFGDDHPNAKAKDFSGNKQRASEGEHARLDKEQKGIKTKDKKGSYSSKPPSGNSGTGVGAGTPAAGGTDVGAGASAGSAAAGPVGIAVAAGATAIKKTRETVSSATDESDSRGNESSAFGDLQRKAREREKERETQENDEKNSKKNEKTSGGIKVFIFNCVLIFSIMSFIMAPIAMLNPCNLINAIARTVTEKVLGTDEENEVKDGDMFFVVWYKKAKQGIKHGIEAVSKFIDKLKDTVTGFFDGATEEGKEDFKDTKNYKKALPAYKSTIERYCKEAYEAEYEYFKKHAIKPKDDVARSLESFKSYGNPLDSADYALLLSAYSAYDFEIGESNLAKFEKKLEKEELDYLTTVYHQEKETYEVEKTDPVTGKKYTEKETVYWEQVDSLTSNIEKGTEDSCPVLSVLMKVKPKGTYAPSDLKSDYCKELRKDEEEDGASASGDAMDNKGVGTVNNYKGMCEYYKTLCKESDLDDNANVKGGAVYGIGDPNHPCTLTEEQINQILKIAKDTDKKISKNRLWFILTAISYTGRIPYNQGINDGMSVAGANPRTKIRGWGDWFWKQYSTTAKHKFGGLDCSSFVDFSLLTSFDDYNHAGGMYNTGSWASCAKTISKSDLKPGDFLNNAGKHIAIYIGQYKGNAVVVEESGSHDNVFVNYTANGYYNTYTPKRNPYKGIEKDDKWIGLSNDVGYKGTDQRLKVIAAACSKNAQKYGVNAQGEFGQICLEAGYGAGGKGTTLANKYNNLGGVVYTGTKNQKEAGAKPVSLKSGTWAAFPSIDSFMEYHAKLLASPKYQNSLHEKSVRQWAKIVCLDGYCKEEKGYTKEAWSDEYARRIIGRLKALGINAN